MKIVCSLVAAKLSIGKSNLMLCINSNATAVFVVVIKPSNIVHL